MCNNSHSESGACTHIDKCPEYLILEQRVRDLQAVLDKARAVSASWDQWFNAEDVSDIDSMFPALEQGMAKLAYAVDTFDMHKGA